MNNNETFIQSRWLFLRSLGVVYFFAFFSLWDQIQGLLGSQGILPACNYLAIINNTLGRQAFFYVPTIFWFNCSDLFLQSITATGIIVSLLVILDMYVGPCLLVLWICYLSLVSVSQVFLSYQWDALLLEAGFLAIFLAPWKQFSWKRPQNKIQQSSPKLILFLFHLLLFKLLFLSGLVKLLSGDPTWRNLTALTFHYWSQPLPTPLAWWTAQIPLWFSKLSTILVFANELLVPFFIFAPRKLRLLAAALIILFQVLIALTGNYCFFNVLTIGLSLLLIDDQSLNKLLPKQFTAPANVVIQRPQKWQTVFAIAIISLNCLRISEPILARQVSLFFYPIEQFEIVNNYGLFAVMTTTRQEIIMEGSNDGKTWLAYEFKYKPGDLRRAPPWIAPYQPRLDWQMWFAALSDFQSNPWFVNFSIGLLKGSKPVLALLKTNPFPNSPPRYIRAELYNYYFTNFSEKAISHNWWKRSPAGTYFPVATLRGDRNYE